MGVEGRYVDWSAFAKRGTSAAWRDYVDLVVDRHLGRRFPDEESQLNATVGWFYQMAMETFQQQKDQVDNLRKAIQPVLTADSSEVYSVREEHKALLHGALQKLIEGTRDFGEKRVTKAVVIGINYTRAFPAGRPGALDGCCDDAAKVRDYLLEKGGVDPKNLLMLVDDTIPPAKPEYANRLLPTVLPKGADIISALRWLVKGSQPNDYLFLHFSGHGTQLRRFAHDELDGKDEAIIPLDFANGVIDDNFLYEILVENLRQGVTLTCMMDCCHSGTLLDLPYGKECTKQDTAGLLKGTLSEDTWQGGLAERRSKRPPPVNAGTVLAFSGCMDDQTSKETSQRAGAATTSLLYSLGKLSSPEQRTLGKVLQETRLYISDTLGIRNQDSQLTSSVPLSLEGPLPPPLGPIIEPVLPRRGASPARS